MDYGTFVAMRLAKNWRCAVRWPGCTIRAQGLHHLRKRSASGRLCSRLNTIPCCNACNGAIEQDPELAHLLGLVVREGDPWWPWLGVRLPSGRKL